MKSPVLALAAALAAAGLAVPAVTAPTATAAQPAAAARSVKITDGCVRSVPEPGTRAKVKICYTLFKPARAHRRHRVPMLMHSHGWGGSRATAAGIDQVRGYLDAGYGVLSFDQRGFGESGGKAYVENPAYEGRDVRRLVRRIATLRWVQKDGRRDPRLGAVGGSYGGGYQFVGAFEQLRTRGKPVFDALAPEITWHDLSESLAPEGVVRTEWAAVLGAGALPSDALPPSVYQALVEGVATGQWPDGSIPGTQDLSTFFRRNGPKWHVQQGRRLDIPVLLGQGTTDTLFNLQQGLAIWRTALTRKARRHSIFVGYNGGHVLPAVLPAGVDVTSDPCSRKLGGGDFQRLAIRFFDEQLRARKRTLKGYGRVHLATPTGGCVTTRSVAPNRAYDVGTVTTPTVAGAPVATEIAKGPLTVAGSPYLTGKVTALGLDSRAFYGLAVGTSPLDARLVQNNVLPLREPTSVQGVARRVALPSVGVQVPAGQSLYLLATPISDTFVGMGSRVPGLITIDDTQVHLPVVRR
ncbi:alpha/beta hydrolase [Nocardioides dongkuii]|uniref:alpha/beta hydrolase n=1 Tax=Nocardioides dongkuii TaxID=2760089 RepID=UPI001877D96D|nr:alpha/beta hydrolase [Nocardioides dongkuii]